MTPENDRLRRRIGELEAEAQKGLGELERLEQQRTRLRATLLRIDGALTLARELLAAAAPDAARAVTPATAHAAAAAE